MSSKLSKMLKKIGGKPATKSSVIPDLEAAPAFRRFSYRKIKQRTAELYELLQGEVTEEAFWQKFFQLYLEVYAPAPRAGRKIHPSTLRSDCTRRIVYELSGVRPTDRPHIEPKTQRTFDTGTFWHTYLQSKLLESGRLVRMEVPVVSEELMINGRADGLLEFTVAATEVLVLLEIKTINSYGFGRLSGPMEHHLFQASIYATILGVKKILFLYVNKDTSELKEYLVPVDLEMFNEAVEIITEIKEYLAAEELPDRVCDARTCKRAQGCDYRTHCFSHE